MSYSKYIAVCDVRRSYDSLLLQQHGEPLQAAGVQVKPLGHQVLVEGAEGAVVLSDWLDWSQPLHMDH